MLTKQHLSTVAEYKICAILKYYNENVIKKKPFRWIIDFE